MKIRHLTLFAMPLCILGIGLGSSGCSDSGADPGVSASGSGGAAAGGTAGSGVAGASAGGGNQNATGGTPGTMGGTSNGQAGAAGSPPGAAGSSAGMNTGGMSTGGMNTGGSASGSSPGGSSSAGSSAGGSGGGGNSGPCTASKSTGKNASGTGPHQVTIETNSDSGIKCGTIYRPKDLAGTEKFPIFVWGNGACDQNGLSNQAAMAEIASWGYFVVADGTPGGSNACAKDESGKSLLAYVTWAISENGKSCSAYHQKLETTKVAADGFSCGGVMAENISGDPRLAAAGITSSGLHQPNDALYAKIHTPFKIMNGSSESGEIAYANGLRDYNEISALGKPVIYFVKKSAGHGGDLHLGRGDFNRVNLAWLNWQLKGDMGATGKGFLVGAACTFCTDSGWEYKIANIQ